MSRLVLGCLVLTFLVLEAPPAPAAPPPAVVQEVHEGAKGKDGKFHYHDLHTWGEGDDGGHGDSGKRVSSISPDGILASPGPIKNQDEIGVYGESIGGEGGKGGGGTDLVYSYGGKGGKGGDGGQIQIENSYSISTSITTGSDKQPIGIYGVSHGGDGGKGGDGKAYFGKGKGGDGGEGGAGGQVNITNQVKGVISTEGESAYGIFAQSLGGHGGEGGSGGGIWAKGGSGSSAGGGGQVEITNYGPITTQGNWADGILAQSLGGWSGKGGSGSGLVGYGGDSHSAGDGGAVQVNNTQAAITTNGKGANAILAQSIGGGGGSAGSSKGLVALGGDGSAGGWGGSVTVDNTGALQTQGSGSNGIYAQSVGGGGGDGGNAGALVAIGGKSDSTSSKAGSVTVTNQGDIQATSSAIYVQSVGGGGGRGGLAKGEVSIGGSGHGGGDGGAVSVTSTGALFSSEANGSAIYAQSVGGGGGDGGNADAGGLWTSVAIGGKGDKGGNGNTVTVTTNPGGKVTTQGANSYGILAQSLGGGGGRGGSAVSGSVGENIDVSLAVGGHGGGGGHGDTVTVTSGTDIATQGANAHGIFAQSVGGGGGAGGYSIAASGSAGLSASLGIGGKGGGGGYGGSVNVTSQAGTAITTAGNNACGLYAQSVGGGGGDGGYDVAATLAEKGISVGIGGKGGGGGNGGTVTVTSQAGTVIKTSGHNASGLLAQSTGGGGGNGGFNVAATAGQTGVSVGLGGSGGSGGQGSEVKVNIESDSTAISEVYTTGNNSSAILAQSVGGGGGNSGFNVSGAVTKYGSVNVSLGVSGGSGGGGSQVEVTSSAVLNTSGAASRGVLAQSVGGGGGNGDFSVSGAVYASSSIGVSLGGAGGSGGGGGQVKVNTSEKINTSGDDSAAIMASSVGGGGGAGGFSVAGDVSGGDLNVSLGGSGGDGGEGGAVQVVSSSDIVTQGKNSSGLEAQSVGKGGGHGDFSVTGALFASSSVGVSLGGSGGGGGDGGTVNVTSTGGITTSEMRSSGVLAQSIGGGGGNGSFSVSGSLSLSQASASVGVSLGGSGGTGGNGGQVTLNVDGAISTSGSDAVGLLAQSIGGGGGNGGFSVAGSLSGLAGVDVSLGGSGRGGGTGGAVSLTTSSTIATQGKNSHGIEAQSIGKGGGNGGWSVGGAIDTGIGQQGSLSVAVSLGGKGGKGDSAGAVEVTSTGASITTAADHAKGLLAQSIGDGGGNGGWSGSLAISKNFSASLSFGGEGGTGGYGGSVTVKNYSAIATTGQGSEGILAQSLGGGGGDGGLSLAGGFTGSGKSVAPSLSFGGDGGQGGNASEVTVLSHGSAISTSGDDATAVEAQSVGGGGGNGHLSLSLAGGHGFWPFAFASLPFLHLGSRGGGGGNGAAVVLNNTSDISTSGENSKGIFAQSVGGGGGKGSVKINGQLGAGTGGFNCRLGSTGAAAGFGGNAGDVTVIDLLEPGALERVIRTQGENSSGIEAQSIGKGGGDGGAAYELGISSNEGWRPNINYAFGGEGGSGGAAGAVEVQSASSIITQGNNSDGILAQSIGGGGGHGGMAVAVTIGTKASKLDKIGNISITKGGNGGSGGQAEDVTVTSYSTEIATTGHSAFGINAQSVGGGGGSGGCVINVNFAVSGAQPGTALSLSLGGNGGSGGSGGAVTVTSGSKISTGATDNQDFVSGNDSPGISAQSVGGGGGSGGYSIAGMFNASAGMVNSSVAVSLGGTGGDGNTSGAVTVTSTGATIQTLGDRSEGISAQSIGGGGGKGGYSIAGSLTAAPFISGELSISVGGNGGHGADAAAVTVNNSSSIFTGWVDHGGLIHGHDSPAISAKSLGHGGGAGGISVDGGLSLATFGFSIGGKGGGSGNGGTVTVNNDALELITQGDRSPGINASSIGKGGGDGGFSITGSLSGGNLSFSMGGMGGGGGSGDQVMITSGSIIQTTGNYSQAILAQSIGNGGGNGGFSVDGYLASTSLGIGIGANGGGGGNGGAVTVKETGGLLATKGKGAAGIMAQSIGGGGGSGGFGIGAGVVVSVPVYVGAKDGASGNGGQVQVATSSSISTQSDDSPAILAQSIGGGGGAGGVSVTTCQESANVTVGGKDQAVGDGGAVLVYTTGTSLTTSGQRAAGIVAQSIGGGGGVGWAADETNAVTGGIILGGQQHSQGNGGQVTITNSSNLTVAGLGSHGLVAQSIGGGGGLASTVGQYATNYAIGALHPTGDAGEVVITNNGNLTLNNDAACGLVAQSIGGGGGLISHTSTSPPVPLNISGSINPGDYTNWGSGYKVTVVNNGDITCSGAASIAIAAQSLGGGGGLNMSTGRGGTACGESGNSGDVYISQSGTITMTGQGSVGIYAASEPSPGGAGGNIIVDFTGSLSSQGNQSTGIMASTKGSVNPGSALIYIAKGASLDLSHTGAMDQAPLALQVGMGNNQIFNYGSITSSGGLIKLNSPGSGSFTFNNWGTLSSVGDLSLVNGSIFNQLDGNNTIAGDLAIGQDLQNQGSYTLRGGKLQVNDIKINSGGYFLHDHADLTFNSMNIQPGGGFTGGGIMQGTVISSGFFNPGTSVGTLTVSGSYSHAPGGAVFIDEIASATDYDRLIVTGTPGSVDLSRALDDTLEPRLLPGTFRPKNNQVFPGIITSTGPLLGRLERVINHPTLSWQAIYNTNSVDLMVQRDYANPSLGLNGNQSAVARALNGMSDITSGDMATALNAIDYLTDNASVRQAYKQISPEKAGAMCNLALTGATFQMRQQAQRVSDLRFGHLGGGGGGLEAFNLNYSRAEGLMLAYNAPSLAGLLSEKPRTAADKPWGLYLYPSLLLGSQQSTLNQTGYNYTAAGFTAGADYRLRDRLVAGLATGYSNTSAGFYGSGGSVQTNTWPITAYTAYLGQSWYAYGSLGYALNLFNLERGINFGGLQRTAKGSTTGHQFNAYAEAGYDVKAKKVMVTPVVSFSYSGLWVDGYTEKGAGALNLKMGSQSADSMQTGVGLKVAAPIKRGPVTVVPQAYATYQHEFANGSRNLNASLNQPGGAFTWRTDAPGRDFALVGARVDINSGKNFQVGLSYNAEVGRGGSTAHSVYGGVRWQF